MPSDHLPSLKSLITIGALLLLIKVIPWYRLDHYLTSLHSHPLTSSTPSVTTPLNTPTAPQTPTSLPPPQEKTDRSLTQPLAERTITNPLAFGCDQNTALPSPIQFTCIGHAPDDSIFILNKIGTYPSGGVYNHHFNNTILAPFVHTPKSEIIEYKDTIWYKAPDQTSHSELLLHYSARQLSKTTKVDSKTIERLIAYLLNHRDDTLLSLVLEKNTAGLSRYITNHSIALSSQDQSDLIHLLPAWLTLRQIDSTYQELRNLYIPLRLFEIDDVLNKPELYATRQTDGHLYLPYLYHTNLTYTGEGLPLYRFMVMDFAQLKTASDGMSPTLITTSPSALDIWNNLTEIEIRHQLEVLAHHIHYPLPRQPRKTNDDHVDFFETYAHVYPTPNVGSERALEKKEQIYSLLDIFFQASDDTATDTSAPWSKGQSPQFRAISDIIIATLTPKPESNLFNSVSGLYQPPQKYLASRRYELTDKIPSYIISDTQ